MDLDSRRKLSRLRETKARDGVPAIHLRIDGTPAGVMVSTRNLSANYEQLTADYFSRSTGAIAPAGTTVVSWLPFYHDMGLMLGVAAPILGGWRSEIMTPMAFLQRPARWVQGLGSTRGGDRRAQLRVRPGGRAHQG